MNDDSDETFLNQINLTSLEQMSEEELNKKKKEQDLKALAQKQENYLKIFKQINDPPDIFQRFIDENLNKKFQYECYKREWFKEESLDQLVAHNLICYICKKIPRVPFQTLDGKIAGLGCLIWTYQNSSTIQKEARRDQRAGRQINKAQVTCEFCTSDMNFKEFQFHVQTTCEKLMTECEYCKSQFLQGQKDQHIASCSEYVISCPFEGICSDTFPRKQLFKHLVEKSLQCKKHSEKLCNYINVQKINNCYNLYNPKMRLPNPSTCHCGKQTWLLKTIQSPNLFSCYLCKTKDLSRFCFECNYCQNSICLYCGTHNYQISEKGFLLKCGKCQKPVDGEGQQKESFCFVCRRNEKIVKFQCSDNQCPTFICVNCRSIMI